MASFCMVFLVAILAFFQPSKARIATDVSSQLQTYIVQLRAPDHIAHLLNDKQKRESWYASLLSQIVSDDKSSSRLIRSYHHVFHGFAASLTLDEFEALKHLEGVVSAWSDTIEYLHTTYSPQFMGLNTSVGGIWDKSLYGSGIIIAVLDTGINADHLSFHGDGPPPEEWNGKCEAPIRCNNKLIGAKSLMVDGTPEDDEGHGSHVAGIAAGAMVRDANVNGEGSGTASGVGPDVQLAVYRVCSKRECPGYAMLAGFDAAIEDDVDVISVSIGPSSGARPVPTDNKAIGSFAAIKRGIFVAVSAGNKGPSPSTISNEVAWYLTVGSSNTDRDITFNGIRSILEPEYGVGRLNGTSYGHRAPRVARGSSRGPTKVFKGIIKPDIIGPGVDIISASHEGVDTFVIKSGTSMACPHLSGAAGLIKKLHPDWSPAAIKSALMTTANQYDISKRPIQDRSTRQPATPYDMGAGHVDVVRATDPGLVFDIQPDDYIPYLCTDLGLTSQQVGAIVSSNVDCATAEVTSGSSLNLPSIWIDLQEEESVTVPRIFTNVGSRADEVYKVEIEYNVPDKFLITVDPQELQFTDLNSNKNFQLTFTRKASQEWDGTVAASMVWRSDKHVVRSPIMVAL